MFNPLNRKAKTAPSHYPRVPFHIIRCFQLVSSLIVGAIMCYFIWHLNHDDIKTPWTFIWLTSASLASIVALTCTIFLHCLLGLNPRLNIAINSFLAVIWALSWSLLTWYMSGTLRNMCDFDHWNEEVGVMVCRIYKALFTFTLVGLVSTIAALALDIYVRRKQTSRGTWNRLDNIDVKYRPEAARGPFTDDGQNRSTVALASPRESDTWEEPRPSRGPYSEQSGNPAQQGYSHPEEFGRYDTGYRGVQS